MLQAARRAGHDAGADRRLAHRAKGEIAAGTAIGKALLGDEPGDVVDLVPPSKTVQIEIVEATV